MMATYQELYDLRVNDALRAKVAVAAVVAAWTKLAGTPTAAEAAWAKGVIASPDGTATQLVNAVLAANKDASVAAITSASDAIVQTNIDAIVDGLVT